MLRGGIPGKAHESHDVSDVFDSNQDEYDGDGQTHADSRVFLSAEPSNRIWNFGAIYQIDK